MIRKKPIDSLRISEDAKRKLRFYAKSLTQGKDIDYRTTMFSVRDNVDAPIDSGARISGEAGLRPLSRDFIVKCFIPQIYELVREYPTIRKFESEFEKYTLSSRSKELPWDKKKARLEESFHKQDQALLLANYPDGSGILEEASVRLEKYIRQYIPIKSLRPTSIDVITQRMVKDSNGGFPYLLKGHVSQNGKVIEDNVPLYVKVALEIQDRIGAGEEVPVELRAFGALSRLQEGKVENGQPQTKNRIVGGDPHGATILAGYAYPFLDACHKIPTRRILTSLDYLNEQLSTLVRTSKKTILSADQSAFDNHIRGEIVAKYIVPIIMNSFNGDGKDKEKAALSGYLTEHMGTDPIVCPDGVGFGRHGMPSGVLFVNEIDSIYLQFVTYVYNIVHGTERYTTVAVQGDDQVMLTELTTEVAATEFEKDSALMNLEANADKQWIAKDSCTFVKRLGTRECPDGYRSKIGSLVAEMNMERAKNWKRAMYEARGGAILCNHYLSDPGISSFFAQISMGYDTYQLGYKLENGYIGVIRRAGGAEDVSRRLDLASYANHLGTVQAKNKDYFVLEPVNLTLQEGQNKSKSDGLEVLHGSWVGDSL